jgi:type II secretory pathway pseudopilin PulG
MSYSRVRKRPGSQDGVTILETLIAVSILLIVSVGILAMGMVAMTTTENQGHRAARTAEYAQDKTEQLMSLAYTDSTSDTTVFPTANGGGSGLSVGGSADPNAPVAQYVDYLDADGNLQPSGGGAPAGWFYNRNNKPETDYRHDNRSFWRGQWHGSAVLGLGAEDKSFLRRKRGRHGATS